MPYTDYNLKIQDYTKKSTEKKQSGEIKIDKLSGYYQKIRIDDSIYPKTTVRLVDIKHAFED